MNLFEAQSAEFKTRHIGPNEADTMKMLETIGVSSMAELIDNTVPSAIRMKKPLNIPAAINENGYLQLVKEMSQKMQIFAITHLPQIAAKGTAHFKVSKATIGEDTQSELKLLTSEERIVEIAQMLSGTVVSDSALNHAKALLN